MSFRQYGGINYASRNNIVKNNYTNANNLSVMAKVGQPSSIINVDSGLYGLGGNITFKQLGYPDYGIMFSDGSFQNAAVTSTDSYWTEYIPPTTPVSTIYYTGRVLIGANPIVVGGTIPPTVRLVVKGDVSINGQLNVGYVNGSGIGVSTFSVIGASGNTSISGTLTVTGATSLNNGLQVMGTASPFMSLGASGINRLSHFPDAGSGSINYITVAGDNMLYLGGSSSSAPSNSVITNWSSVCSGLRWNGDTSLYLGMGGSSNVPSNNITFNAASTNSVAISTNGATRMTIDSGGNVGIGTTTPSKKLDIVGTLGVSGATNLSSSLNMDNAIPANRIINNVDYRLQDTASGIFAGQIYASGTALSIVNSVNSGTIKVFTKDIAGSSTNTFTISSTGVSCDSVTATTFNGALNGNATTATNIAGGANGSLVYQTGISTTTTLAIGTNNQVLVSNGTIPVWTTPAVITTSNLSSVLTAGNSAGSNGINMNSQSITNATAMTATTFNGTLNGNATTATNITLGTAGDLLYQSASNTTTKLGIGANTYFLTSSGSAPVWTAPSVALSSYALIASPTFTGIPNAPTATAGTNNTQIATTAFVTTAVASGGTNYWTASGTNIYNSNTGNVGIGNISPSYKLDVSGNMRISSDALINGLTVGQGINSGVYNTIIGNVALSVYNDGYNTAVGYQSLNITTSDSNTAVGYQSLKLNTSGYGNTALGSGTLNINSIGNINTAIGTNAGTNNIGSNNTFVGGNTNTNSNSITYLNSTAIGASAIITASNQIMLGGSNGGVYPGVSVPGTLTVSGACSAASFNTTSDYRIKENVSTLNDSSFTIDNLRPVTYTNILSGKQDIGLIAHELQEHYPFLVTGEKDGPVTQSVNYIGLIALLVKEIQDLKQDIKILKMK